MNDERNGIEQKRYSYSDLVIVSALPFPELAETAAATKEPVFITLGEPCNALPSAPIEREWRLADDTLWATFQRIENAWFVRFPDYAQFVVAEDGGSVEAHPVAGVAMSTVRHLILNQILPLVLCARGRYAFHASAVEVGERAAVFSGASGAGKSTLALHFARNGDAFLSDDVVVFEQRQSHWQVVPSYPSLRVCQDSLAQASGETMVVVSSAEYSEKARVLAGNGVGFQDRRVRLGAMYLLGKAADGVEITPVTGMESVMELVRSSFLLDPTRRDYMRAHLDWAGELAATGRLFRLAYPHDFAKLEETRTAILAHIRSLE